MILDKIKHQEMLTILLLIFQVDTTVTLLMGRLAEIREKELRKKLGTSRLFCYFVHEFGKISMMI